jgi:hypothetical protein
MAQQINKNINKGGGKNKNKKTIKTTQNTKQKKTKTTKRIVKRGGGPVGQPSRPLLILKKTLGQTQKEINTLEKELGKQAELGKIIHQRTKMRGQTRYNSRYTTLRTLREKKNTLKRKIDKCSKTTRGTQCTIRGNGCEKQSDGKCSCELSFFRTGTINKYGDCDPDCCEQRGGGLFSEEKDNILRGLQNALDKIIQTISHVEASQHRLENEIIQIKKKYKNAKTDIRQKTLRIQYSQRKRELERQIGYLPGLNEKKNELISKINRLARKGIQQQHKKAMNVVGRMSNLYGDPYLSQQQLVNIQRQLNELSNRNPSSQRQEAGQEAGPPSPPNQAPASRRPRPPARPSVGPPPASRRPRPPARSLVGPPTGPPESARVRPSVGPLYQHNRNLVPAPRPPYLPPQIPESARVRPSVGPPRRPPPPAPAPAPARIGPNTKLPMFVSSMTREQYEEWRRRENSKLLNQQTTKLTKQQLRQIYSLPN